MKKLHQRLLIALHAGMQLILPGCGFITPADTTLNIDEDNLNVAILAPATSTDITSLAFDDTPANTPITLSILLKNHGELDAESLSMTVTNADGSGSPYAFAGGAYPGTSGTVTGTCSDSLAVDETCTVILEFSPTAAGTFTATLGLSYFNGITTVSGDLDLSGTATP